MFLAEVILKDGTVAIIREATLEDKDALVSFYSSLSEEVLRYALPQYDKNRIELFLSRLNDDIVLLALNQ